MGASEFLTRAKGKTAAEAFNAARAAAQHEVGHGGYTGTVADKRGVYGLRRRPEGATTREIVELLRDLSYWYEGDPPIVWPEWSRGHEVELKHAASVYDDKWGPALAIPEGEGEWVICGWASD